MTRPDIYRALTRIALVGMVICVVIALLIAAFIIGDAVHL